MKTAWDKRVKTAKSKKGEEGTPIIAAYNAFLTLTNIIHEANRLADSDLWRLYTVSIGIGSQIDRLLLEDSYSDITRVTIYQFTEEAPRPLSWEDYDKAAEWYEGYSTEDLEELANELTGAYTRRQGYEILEVPDEFLKKISTPEVDYGGEDEGIRRKWVESEGEDAILTKYFAGDQERFEAWKKHGGHPEFNGREWDAMSDEINDRLINKVTAGELEGGVCFGLENQWGFTPALGWNREDPDNSADLRLPAWAIFRSIWMLWLYDKGIFAGDEKRVDKNSPDVLNTFYNVDGTLQEDQITEKAKEFYLDCQKKPWGGDLIDADKVNFAELGRFLCADASPLLGYYAPDLGTVNVKAFHEAEGDDPFMGSSEKAGEAWYYATLRGLRKIADELGATPGMVGKNFVREFYYPTDDPKGKRETISNLLCRMGQLRTSHRSFSWKEKNKRDISSFLGQDFHSPLERAIRNIGEVFDDVETFKLTYELISQEFFEGIPVLAPILRDRLKGIEEALKVTETSLNQFIDMLSSDIWNVDTSSLRLVKKGPAVDWSRVMAGATIYAVDNERDSKRFPTRLDDGKSFEEIAKKITGMDYAGIIAAAMKGNRGIK
ncbi:MAG: hypothetical protein BWY98_01205 [Tenericutes bacterium ADurb.BinA155]|nr:MAG: hypothetical protein BWY98_01205 [Tenericutes bacterium ADurb.BinA155]